MSDEIPTGASAQARLLALALVEAERQHWLQRRDGGFSRNGHQPEPFGACEHSDCKLVRELAGMADSPDARLLTLVEQWRKLGRDANANRRSARATLFDCADELAAALRRLPPPQQKTDAIDG